MVVIPELYEESVCFDPNTIQEEQQQQGYHQNLSQQDAAAAIEMQYQQQLNMEMEQNDHQNQFVLQEMAQQHDTNWEEMQKIHHQSFNSSLPETLLNMFPLPRCSAPSLLSPNSFANSSTTPSAFLTSLGLMGDHHLPTPDGASASTVVYDPLLPLNLPPQPPLLGDLFHSLPHGYNLGGRSRSVSLFSGVDDGETLSNGGFYQDGDGRTFAGNGVFEFAAVKGKHSKDTKHYPTERQRRVHLNDKFQALRSLIPSPTKNDRASIVLDAIGYINELKRTVNELKIVVERKRCSRERVKRQNTAEGVEVTNIKTEDVDHPYSNGSGLRSSWLHRKSKNTEVDVRIVDDEVTVKLVQQKRINFVLFVSKVLDDLELDLHHVAGGLIGDYYSFLFNCKICEGSTVYAHAIANKLIEIVDKQYVASSPINGY